MDSNTRSLHKSKSKCLIDLNTDCLLHICSFLSPIDLFRLSLASDIFNMAVEHYIEFYGLQIEELLNNLALSEIEEIFRRFGQYIKRVDPMLESSEEDEVKISKFFNLLSMHCNEIEEIEIWYPWNPDFETCKRIFESSSKTLQKVSVSQKISAAMDDSFNELFCQARNLQSLELCDCNISGKYLANFPNLTELSFECCESIEPKYFIEICKVVKLKMLNIAGCRLLDDQAFKTLSETQTDLEELFISNNYKTDNFGIVGRLKSLRKIELCESSKQLTSLLKLLDELIAHHGQDLEAFVLDSNFCYEREATIGILTRLADLQNLRKLTIPNLNYMNNDGPLRKVIQRCRLLENVTIIVYSNHHWLTNEAILLFTALKHLSQIQIGPIFPFDTNLIPSIYKVLKMKNSVQLNFHIGEDCADDDLVEFLETQEYKLNEPFLKIHLLLDTFND